MWIDQKIWEKIDNFKLDQMKLQYSMKGMFSYKNLKIERK